MISLVDYICIVHNRTSFHHRQPRVKDYHQPPATSHQRRVNDRLTLKPLMGNGVFLFNCFCLAVCAVDRSFRRLFCWTKRNLFKMNYLFMCEVGQIFMYRFLHLISEAAPVRFDFIEYCNMLSSFFFFSPFSFFNPPFAGVSCQVIRHHEYNRLCSHQNLAPQQAVSSTGISLKLIGSEKRRALAK